MCLATTILCRECGRTTLDVHETCDWAETMNERGLPCAHGPLHRIDQCLDCEYREDYHDRLAAYTQVEVGRRAKVMLRYDRQNQPPSDPSVLAAEHGERARRLLEEQRGFQGSDMATLRAREAEVFRREMMARTRLFPYSTRDTRPLQMGENSDVDAVKFCNHCRSIQDAVDYHGRSLRPDDQALHWHNLDRAFKECHTLPSPTPDLPVTMYNDDILKGGRVVAFKEWSALTARFTPPAAYCEMDLLARDARTYMQYLADVEERQTPYMDDLGKVLNDIVQHDREYNFVPDQVVGHQPLASFHAWIVPWESKFRGHELRARYREYLIEVGVEGQVTAWDLSRKSIADRSRARIEKIQHGKALSFAEFVRKQPPRAPAPDGRVCTPYKILYNEASEYIRYLDCTPRFAPQSHNFRTYCAKFFNEEVLMYVLSSYRAGPGIPTFAQWVAVQQGPTQGQEKEIEQYTQYLSHNGGNEVAQQFMAYWNVIITEGRQMLEGVTQTSTSETSQDNPALEPVRQAVLQYERQLHQLLATGPQTQVQVLCRIAIDYLQEFISGSRDLREVDFSIPQGALEHRNVRVQAGSGSQLGVSGQQVDSSPPVPRAAQPPDAEMDNMSITSDDEMPELESDDEMPELDFGDGSLPESREQSRSRPPTQADPPNAPRPSTPSREEAVNRLPQAHARIPMPRRTAPAPDPRTGSNLEEPRIQHLPPRNLDSDTTRRQPTRLAELRHNRFLQLNPSLETNNRDPELLSIERQQRRDRRRHLRRAVQSAGAYWDPEEMRLDSDEDDDREGYAEHDPGLWVWERDAEDVESEIDDDDDAEMEGVWWRENGEETQLAIRGRVTRVGDAGAESELEEGEIREEFYQQMEEMRSLMGYAYGEVEPTRGRAVIETRLERELDMLDD